MESSEIVKTFSLFQFKLITFFRLSLVFFVILMNPKFFRYLIAVYIEPCFPEFPLFPIITSCISAIDVS